MVRSADSARVVMFSVADLAVKAAQQVLDAEGHKLVGIVTAPGPRGRRTDEYRSVLPLARPGLDVIVSNHPDRWADMIRPMKPDIILCSAFNWKIPKAALEVPRLGAINGHDACLPKFRGRNATGWALRTGEPGFGMTFHRMTPEFDDGPIMAQRSIDIGDDDDSEDVLARFIEVATECLPEAIDRMLAGDPGIPQDESQATYAPGAFEPEWREINWNKPVRDVFFQIRSWCGVRDVPRGAFGEVDGKRVLITKAKPDYDQIGSNCDTPGTLLSCDDGGMLIQCADGPLRILHWEEIPPASPQ